jgi:hypothetical protein
MTMTYSWEKKYNPWDLEPDVFDLLLAEETETENAKVNNEISIEDIEDEDIELNEEFDL